jgi:hypothetical protein
MNPVPHQSLNAKYPGLTIAAAELGVHRGHLHRVIRGERHSQRLLGRWNQWLADHPEFARLQKNSKAS